MCVSLMTDNTITDRMKGAREFARFVVGEAHLYGERTKDTIREMFNLKGDRSHNV